MKSWATPLVSWPTASIFWACRSMSSARTRSWLSRSSAASALSRSSTSPRSSSFTRCSCAGEGRAIARGSNGHKATAVTTETIAVASFTSASTP